MYTFIAKNDKQLGLCLKLLYAEQIKYSVRIELTEKKRVIYLITVAVDDNTGAELDSKYRILIG